MAETEWFHMGKPMASHTSLAVGMKYAVCTYHHIIRPKGNPCDGLDAVYLQGSDEFMEHFIMMTH